MSGLPNWCTCPNDCDCDGVLVCDERAGRTTHRCQRKPGHAGPHQCAGHSWLNSGTEDGAA